MIPGSETGEESVELQASEVLTSTQLAEDEIRVINIDPAATDEEPIVCSLRHMKLPRRTEAENDDDWAPWLWQPRIQEVYHTLSYAWGSTYPDGSHLTNTIVCNGSLLRITTTLHAALKRIRGLQIDDQPATKWPVWIDAVCINQDNLVERSEQVRQMDRVYQLSARLIIWLGEISDPNEHGFVQRLSDICQEYSGGELEPEHWERLRLLGHKSPFTEGDRQSMRRILRRPWFGRRWVIQEAYHKRADLRLICLGDFAIESHRFERALYEMNLLHQVPALQRAQPQQRSLLHNLQVCHPAQCSDPRDYIYALVSISPERRTMAIDYTISTRETFFRFAKEHVSVELLVSASTRCAPRCGGLASLPTWAPDWGANVRYRSAFHERAVNDCFDMKKLSSVGHGGRESPNVRIHPKDDELLLAVGWLLTPCLHARHCQEFKCGCAACRFCRSAIRSSDGVAVVAGLSADHEPDPILGDNITISTRQLLLIDGSSIGFWLEPSPAFPFSAYHDPSYNGTPFRLTNCVPLPEHVSHKRFSSLLEDIREQTICMR